MFTQLANPVINAFSALYGNATSGGGGGARNNERADAARQREEQRNMAAQNRPSMYRPNSRGGMSPTNSLIAGFADLYDREGSGPPSNFFDEPGGDDGSGSGSGRAALPPVYLPRLEGPNDAQLAQLVFNAVAAARMPFDAERAALRDARVQGDRQITGAGREARSQIDATLGQWRAATSGLENRVGSAYDAAARNLAANMSAANESMLSRGFRPTAVNPEILAAMQNLGANARGYASVRRMAGEDQGRDALVGASQVTQAARGTLANTYALVLGQIGRGAAAAESQARLGAENQIFALREEIARLNNQTAIQEALANSGR